ncbi:lamin tail domain-containing protein [Verrucomicrobiales bacterium]|nr:lamin tail domain-containing protein [Verrucomicrobiales bacterium]
MFRLVLLLLIGLASVRAGTDTVVTFNEIHYHPDEAADPEWIELHNQMSMRVDLSGWRLSGGIDFDFPEGTVIPSKGYLIVQGPGLPLPLSVGPFDGQLDNAGESLTLRDRNDRVMDRLDYGDAAPWPIGPDGSGMTLTKRRPSLATAEAESWGASVNAGGTPGAVNGLVMAFEELFLSEVLPGAVELHNRGENPINLEDHFLGAASLGNGSLSPNDFHVVEADAITIGDPVFLTNAEGQLLDAVRVEAQGRGRLEGHGGDWFTTDQDSLGSPNTITLRDEIVISEIMYHFPPLYDQPGTVENEFTERDEEWIELYNRADTPVDLSGWSLAGGIRFEIPPETVLEPEATVIVARDAAILREKYPALVVLGEYKGKLSNSSDTIILRDALGNEADKVRYYDSGRWPEWADGGGSSLELRDPWADNAVPEAWQASESPAADWTEFTYEGRGIEPVRSNNPSTFHEFLMGLLGAGESWVTDVSVIEEPEGAATELVQNGSFNKSVFTDEAHSWRALGTHAKSRAATDPDAMDYFHLIADGPIEHTYNNISTTFPSGHKLDSTITYKISFRARWIKGSPLLNTRLYLNRLSVTHVLPMPERLGNPGSGPSQNSGPTMDDLQITPLAPSTNEPVTISVKANDRQTIAGMTLHYRTSNGQWESSLMAESDQRWAGFIPGHPNNTLLHFYIEAKDSEGATSWFPSKGPDSRALLRVGMPRLGERSLNDLRLLIWPEEHDFMRLPQHAVSNARVGGTLIVNGEDYHFDAGVRLRGSPYGRRGNRMGYNVVLGKEKPYRGVHDSIAIDRGSVMPNGNSSGFLEVKTGAGVNELIINQIAQRAGGIPTTYEDVIFVETPRAQESSLAQLRTARYGANYLDGQYENGAQGATHKFELIYYPTGTVDGRADGLKGPYSAVQGIDIQDMRDDKEAYRFNFIPTNNRDRDDFTGIIRLGEAFSSRTDTQRREKIPQAIDVDQWMRTFAFQSLIGVADTYNMGNAHNLVLYTRPSDGRVLAFPWDLDHGFYYTPTVSPLGSGGTNLGRFINLPENTRLFYGHLDDIIKTAYNTTDMAPWIAHLNELTENNYDQRILDYIKNRGRHVQSDIRNKVGGVFQITSNRGNDFETDSPTVTLEGTGWVDVREIRNETTGQPLSLTWTDLNVWQAEIPLTLGENVIALQAVDFQGNDLGTFFSPGADTIKVTHTGTVEAASANNLIISEIHYHPEGETEDGEFIELQNTSPHPIDLAGIRFTKGLSWEQPTDVPTILQSGALALLVKDPTNFEEFLGTYGESNLANSGETLRLEDRAGALIQEIRYNDKLPWPIETDGLGHSLVYRSGDGTSPYHWRSSTEIGGSPGIVELSSDRWVDDSPLNVNDLGQLSFRYPTTRDDLLWTLQVSTDLHAWHTVEEDLELISRFEDEASGDTIITWKPHTKLTFYRLHLRTQP